MKGVPSRISPSCSGKLTLLQATILLQHVRPAISLGWTSSDAATLYSWPEIVIVIEILVSHGRFCA